MTGLWRWATHYVALLGMTVAMMAGADSQIGRPTPGFVPPPPGSYRLPPIQRAPDGWVLERNYFPRRLNTYTHGAISLLTFMYTYCTDPRGCPLAYATLHAVRRGIAVDDRLKGRVRLVSLSFDPTNDKLARMAEYGGPDATNKEVPWHFLTTQSMATLEPILKGFGQDVQIERTADGEPTRARTHMVKMFLLDSQGIVREIYSSAFLLPEVILNDLRTLALESAP